MEQAIKQSLNLLFNERRSKTIKPDLWRGKELLQETEGTAGNGVKMKGGQGVREKKGGFKRE